MKIPKLASRSSIGFIDRWCKTLLFGKLENIRDGSLEIIEQFHVNEQINRIFHFGNPDAELKASITIIDPRAYGRIVLGGSIGSGESYMDGDWECDDLAQLMRVFVRNRELLQQLDSGLGAITAPLQKVFHRMRRNSVKGSKKNIHAHYDLGNEFFSLFLDPTFMYSSAIFESDQTTLEEAQIEKIDRICKKLNLSARDHVLEIGTGWGGFALHAAQKYGCRVTTATISKEQYEFARERIKKAGLSDRVEVVLTDYRLLRGRFDKIVSIEMIEAVGLEYLDTYFSKCSSLLKPNGQMLLQGITIRDEYYETAKRSVDFIQRYIFPGSGIPSVGSIANSIANKTDLQMAHLEDFGTHYARTLSEWNKRFNANKAKIMELKFSEEFYRLWRFYFGYCEGGFSERSIGVSQFLLLKPAAAREPVLGKLK